MASGRRRTRSAVLWGAVGVLSFLVLVQGYALLVEPLVSVRQAAAVACVVGAASAGVAYAIEHRVAARVAGRAEN